MDSQEKHLSKQSKLFMLIGEGILKQEHDPICWVLHPLLTHIVNIMLVLR